MPEPLWGTGRGVEGHNGELGVWRGQQQGWGVWRVTFHSFWAPGRVQGRDTQELAREEGGQSDTGAPAASLPCLACCSSLPLPLLPTKVLPGL